MNIRLIHYNVKKRLAKLATEDKIDLNPAELDEEINRGIIAWVRDQIALGVESNEIINQKLSTLVVQETVSTYDVANNNYSFEYMFSNLTYEVMHIMRVTADLTATDCSKTDCNIFFTQYDDLHYKLNSNLFGPSIDWCRALYTIGKDSTTLGAKSIFIWTNEDFQPGEITITYIKKPEEVTIGGYNDIDGVAKTVTECDLPEESHDEMIDKVVANIASNLNDPNFQLYDYTYKANQ